MLNKYLTECHLRFLEKIYAKPITGGYAHQNVISNLQDFSNINKTATFIITFSSYFNILSLVFFYILIYIYKKVSHN